MERQFTGSKAVNGRGRGGKGRSYGHLRAKEKVIREAQEAVFKETFEHGSFARVSEEYFRFKTGERIWFLNMGKGLPIYPFKLDDKLEPKRPKSMEYLRFWYRSSGPVHIVKPYGARRVIFRGATRVHHGAALKATKVPKPRCTSADVVYHLMQAIEERDLGQEDIVSSRNNAAAHPKGLEEEVRGLEESKKGLERQPQAAVLHNVALDSANNQILQLKADLGLAISRAQLRERGLRDLEGQRLSDLQAYEELVKKYGEDALAAEARYQALLRENRELRAREEKIKEIFQ